MKFNNALLLAIQIAGVISSPAPSAAEECGDLGVMHVDLSSLPEGVDPNAIRKCADHPAGLATVDKLETRDCWHGSEYGCSKSGWCWKQCGAKGSGQWCWTAFNGGYGDWIACSSSSQCNKKQACGIGDCDACGCSC